MPKAYLVRDPEKPKGDGPCRLLKLWQMGTLSVHMKGVPLVGVGARRAGTIDFCPALAALVRQVSPVQILFSSSHTYSLY
jgi:hypothetical protein